ncbi:MAG TPA: hypothetical protein P5323_00170 [Candidatus Moranbacteria bacterium]|nr:hypothetical protein [Candidatus Moranbacteria bacterium]HRY27540.1 hypothetical protein [Candidatus Moranbacteria bacterium]HSA07769.1 hypothetical protein [Candidatus Moranbacteria bacterium]
MFTSEQIEKFQTIYKNRFGIEISRDEAFEKGVRLVRLVKLIYKPMTKQNYLELKKRQEKIDSEY